MKPAILTDFIFAYAFGFKISFKLNFNTTHFDTCLFIEIIKIEVEKNKLLKYTGYIVIQVIK